MKTLYNIVEGDIVYGVKFEYIYSFIIPSIYILNINGIRWEDYGNIPKYLRTSCGIINVSNEVNQPPTMVNDMFTLDYGIFMDKYKECFNTAMKNVKEITKSKLREHAIKQLWKTHDEVKKALVLNEELSLQYQIDVRFQRKGKRK